MKISDVYQVVADRIISSLEKNDVVWKKSWQSSVTAPMNYHSKRRYRGANVFLLFFAQIEKGFSFPYWLTYKQAKELGGNVKKGEKGEKVYFSSPVHKDESGKIVTSIEEATETYYCVKVFTVFNIAQIEGIDFEIPEEAENEFNPVEEAESILSNYSETCPIIEGNTEAYYVPSKDEIYLPKRERFEVSEMFYRVAFHEMAHSTGHVSRLKREEILKPYSFGSHDYSVEELVAEFSSCFISASLQFREEQEANSVAYIQGWLKKIKEDKSIVYKAMKRASEASDYIFGFSG